MMSVGTLSGDAELGPFLEKPVNLLAVLAQRLLDVRQLAFELHDLSLASEIVVDHVTDRLPLSSSFSKVGVDFVETLVDFIEALVDLRTERKNGAHQSRRSLFPSRSCGRLQRSYYQK